MFVLRERMKNPEELREQVIKVLANKIFERSLRIIEEPSLSTKNNNYNLLPLATAIAYEEVLARGLKVMTFDGSLDNIFPYPEGAGKSGSEIVDTDKVFKVKLSIEIFKKIKEKYPNFRNFIADFRKSQQKIARLKNKELNNDPVGIVCHNFDHHGLEKNTTIDENGNEIEKINFFGRYEKPSACQQLFEKLTDLASAVQKPNLIGFIESLDACDSDSVLCAILIELFQENPDFFNPENDTSHKRLKMIVDIVGLYDVYAGFVTPEMLKSIDLPKSLKEKYENLSEEEKSKNLIGLAIFIKTDVLEDVYKKTMYGNRAKNPKELSNIISGGLNNIKNFITETEKGIQNNEDEMSREPIKYKTFSAIQEGIKSNIIVLNHSLTDKEILNLHRINNNTLTIYIVNKGNEVFSIFCIPPSLTPFVDPKNPTPEELEKRSQELELRGKYAEISQELKNFLDHLFNYEQDENGDYSDESYQYAFDNRQTSSEKPIFSLGCVCGNRDNKIPVDFEQMKKIVNYYINLLNPSPSSYT